MSNILLWLRSSLGEVKLWNLTQEMELRSRYFDVYSGRSKNYVKKKKAYKSGFFQDPDLIKGRLRTNKMTVDNLYCICFVQSTLHRINPCWVTQKTKILYCLTFIIYSLFILFFIYSFSSKREFLGKLFYYILCCFVFTSTKRINFELCLQCVNCVELHLLLSSI